MSINRRAFATRVLTAGGGTLLNATMPTVAVEPASPAMPSFNNRPKVEFPGGWIKETTIVDA